MREIPLTQGLVALVDDEDYDAVAQFNWWVRSKARRTYAAAWMDGKQVLLHRFIIQPGDGVLTDHINHDPLDNRRCNLRSCTSSQNQQHKRKIGGTSRFKGVSWKTSHNCWQAAIKQGGTTKTLGLFKVEEEAALAYNRAAQEMFGEFAVLNDVGGEQ